MLFERQKPDLILLDLMLPGLSGEQVIEKNIRRSGDRSQCKRTGRFLPEMHAPYGDGYPGAGRADGRKNIGGERGRVFHCKNFFEKERHI